MSRSGRRSCQLQQNTNDSLTDTASLPTKNIASTPASPANSYGFLYTLMENEIMYDNESGQVFREWSVPHRPAPIGELDWSRKRPYPSFRPRGSRGPRSLIDMTTNVIANNVGLLSFEHIEPIPIRLAWRIWRFLEARYVLHSFPNSPVGS
jgi:hypothetical protein